MIDLRLGRPVCSYPIESGRNKAGTFEVRHDALQHPPYGLFLIYHHGREIGRQLSYPSREDCYTHWRAAPPREVQTERLPQYLRRAHALEPQAERGSAGGKRDMTNIRRVHKASLA